MAVLAVVGIIYGACVAMVQPDVKKLVAYSSVSHLGFCVLGLFAFNLQGVQGAVIQMVNHGLSTGALFLIVGMLYERRHTRMIADYGGVYKPMPVLGTFFTIVVLSSVALPGLNGFVGEFLILVGAFQTAKVFGVLAASGVVLAAIYLLWMYQRVMHGPIEHAENKSLPDLNIREIATLVPIVLLCFWIGLYPKPFFERTEASLSALVATASHDGGALAADRPSAGSSPSRVGRAFSPTKRSEDATYAGDALAVRPVAIADGHPPSAALAAQPPRRGVPK